MNAKHTPKLCDMMKTRLLGEFIALSANIKNLMKSQISNLTTHLKALEQNQTHT